MPADLESARLHMEALQGVTSALPGAATPDEVGHAVAEHGARALGGTGGVVFTLEHQRGMLRVIGSWGYPAAMVEAFTVLPLSVASPAGEAARERRTVALSSMDELESRYPELAATIGHAAALCAVPLLSGSDVLGAVGVSRSGAEPAGRGRGDRGRGLSIVRALMHAVDEGPDGTTVSVRYRPGAAPAALLPRPEGSSAPRATMVEPPAVTVDRSGTVPVARLSGEVDRSNAAAVEPELLALLPGPMIVDLSGLAFLSSAGLAVLFGLADRCVLAVVAPRRAPFRRALEVAELARVAHIADTAHAALEHFAGR